MKEIIKFIFTLLIYALLGYITIGIYYYIQSPDFILKKEIFKLQLILNLIPVINIIIEIINNIRRK